jgi:hypothetical protein
MMTPTIIDLQIDGHHGSDGSALLPASTSLGMFVMMIA